MSADRVLTTPELLHLIFCFSNTPSVAIGMQVCKFWAEVGKPVLWRVVDMDEQFVGLLRLLAPWDFERFEFRRSLSLAWTRFLECSRLVYTLEIGWKFYNPDVVVTNIYSVLKLISECRPISDVFPNLRTLGSIAYHDPRHASILLHSDVKRWVIVFINHRRCDLSIPLIPTNSIQRLFGLVELEIAGIRADDFLATFVALRDLPCLRTLVLPTHTVSYAVLEALSMCQALQEIRTLSESCSLSCGGKHSLPRPFCKGAFPVLTSLTISGCAYMFSQLLDDKYFPFHITSLAVESSVCIENPSFSAYPKIVGKCSRVTDFMLRDTVIDKPSSFSSLRGFLSYDLTRLRVDTYLQLAYEAIEIEELARSLPKIAVLSLAPSPYFVIGPPLSPFTFNHLCLFARHCRKLTKFAVLVDTTQPCEPLTEDSVVPFAVLQELDLGRTFVRGSLENEAANLLAGLVPIYCRITCDPGRIVFRGASILNIDKAISDAREAKNQRELLCV